MNPCMHDSPSMPSDLLATIEAAEIIGVERSTLSRWVALGRMTVAHQLPGKNGAVLFERAEVERVAAEYRTTGTLAPREPEGVAG